MRAAAILALVLLASGCLVKEYRPAPTPSPTSTSRSGYENFVGNWSLVPGTFQLYSTTTRVEYWDANASQWKGVRDLCTRPQAPYYYDPANETLWLDADYALDPYRPGNLTAVWIQRQAFGRNCDLGGFFGVNEDPMARSLPLMPSFTDYEGTYLFLNVTFHRLSQSPPRHTVEIGGRVFADASSGNTSYEAQDPESGTRARASVDLEYLGEHPFGWIHRYAR